MDDILRALTAREVETSHHGSYTVPVPSARTALVVQGVLKKAKEGEEVAAQDEDLLRRTCSDWLPLRLFSVLFARRLPDEKRHVTLRWLLWSHVPEAVQERFEAELEGQKEGESEEKERRPGYWLYQLSRCLHRFGGSWEELLRTEWPVVLAQLVHVDMARAQSMKDMSDAYVAVKADDDGKAYRQVAEMAAGPGRTAEDEPSPAPEHAMDEEEKEEHLERQMAKLHVAQHSLMKK